MDLAARNLSKILSMQFELSSVHSENPLKINFRCHICGDSKKDKHKTRGWFYETNHGNMRYGCFNCGYNKSFYEYLQDHQSHLLGDYLMEKMQYKNFNQVEPEEPEKQEVKGIKLDPELCTSIEDLDDGHIVKRYIKQRLIPKKYWGDIFYTNRWVALSRSISDEVYQGDWYKEEHRIVIPLRNKEGLIEAVQGRALRNDAYAKYLTIKEHADASKVWGIDKVKPKNKVFIFEGAFDAMFIKNGIAMTGGSMSLSDDLFNDTRIWVLDNEPRAKETVDRLQKLIKAGERVVIWKNCRFEGKDVNNMIMNGAGIMAVNLYLREHIYSGSMALLEFNKWKKV